MMLPPWLAGLPWKWIGIGVAALLLVITAWRFIDRAFDETAEKGRVEERAENAEQIIENVKDADDAREEIKRPGPVGDRVRYDQCLRTARTPANCERFLPEREAD